MPPVLSLRQILFFLPESDSTLKKYAISKKKVTQSEQRFKSYSLSNMHIFYKGFYGKSVFHGILTLIVLVAMSWGCTKGKRIYYLALMCYICVILLFTALELVHWTQRGLLVDVTILSSALVFSVFGWCLLDVLLRSILAKLVPSCIQGFTEVVRTTLAKASVIGASLTGPLLLPYLHWWSIASMLIITLLLFLFVKRRKHLMSVEEIGRLQRSIKIKQVNPL